MQYTNVIWTEDDNNPRWVDGVAIGKFRHFKLGRTTGNYILTYCGKPQDFAENLALNRTIGFLGTEVPTGLARTYLDFWRNNRELFVNVTGAEKVAVLRSYPSMAYNNLETQIAVNMAEQVLQQRQIPFDIIFDQQLGQLGKYQVVVLADQESLADETIMALKNFARSGGGIVMTGNTGRYDRWRRLRKISLPEEMRQESGLAAAENAGLRGYPLSFDYGKGRIMCLPELMQPEGEVKLGMESVWTMPINASELVSAVYWAAGRLPLRVTAPEWIGVSHDRGEGREIIHLFNYQSDRQAGGITVGYSGKIKRAWAVSPDEAGKVIPFSETGGITELRLPQFQVYLIVVLDSM
jgi:hypothetical protein